MSAAASIKFVQGVTTPPAGQAIAAVTGVAVTASNGNDSGIATWAWSLIDAPAASAVAVGSLGASAAMNPVTPDVPGTYLVKLVTVDVAGLQTVDYRAIMVPVDVTYTRYHPGSFALDLKEDSHNLAGQARGWATYLEPYLSVLDRLLDVAPTTPLVNFTLNWDVGNSRWNAVVQNALWDSGGNLCFWANNGYAQLRAPVYFLDGSSPVSPTGGGLLGSVAGYPEWCDNAGVLHRLAHYSRCLNVDYTNATTGQVATNLSFPVVSGETWFFEFILNVQCSSTGGVKVQLTGPTGTLDAQYESSGATVNTPVNQRITALATPTTTATHTVANAPGLDYIAGRFTASANGTFGISMAAVTAAQTAKIFAGGYIRAWKADNV